MHMYTATVIKSGNSYALRIPKRVVEDAHLQVGQKVTIPAPTSTPPVKHDPAKIRAAFLELQRVVAENTKHGVGIGMIQDPVAWQREIRKDRPLPGRD